MLPQELKLIAAEEVKANEEFIQSYFENRSWAEFCCETQIENPYMNIVEKNSFTGNVIRESLHFSSPK